MDKVCKIIYHYKVRSALYTAFAYISLYMLYFPGALTSVLCAVAFYWLNKQGIIRNVSKREMKFSVCMGIIIAISIVWGKNLVEYDSTRVFSAKTILLIIGLCPVLTNIMKIFFTTSFSLQAKNSEFVNTKKVYLLCWFVIFVSYIPVLMAFYPGIVTYDIWDQAMQILSGEYNLKHPLVHTAFMGIIFKTVYGMTGDWNIGVVVHSIIQMLIMTGIYSYISIWIYKQSKSRLLLILSVLFYIFFPLHSLYAIVTTKDVLFSAIVALVVIKLMEYDKNTFSFSVLFFIMLIFRNNAVYASILFLPALILYNKKGRKKAFFILFALILLFPYNYILHNFVHATDGPKSEMYSVPAQQIARVYNLYNDDLSEMEKADLEELIRDGADTFSRYESRKADVIKERVNQDVLESNVGKYLGIWASLGLRHPGVYLDAWMSLINGFFCFDDKIPDSQTYRTYLEIRCYAPDEMGLHFSSKNIKLFDLYDSLFREGTCQKFPFLSIICQPAFYDWTLILSLAYIWQKKRYYLMPPLLLLLAIFVTFLLGPVAIFRYIYPFVVCFPLIIFTLFKSAMKNDMVE